ncbi:phosphodiesterase, mj0936 family [Seminavis robusta]|uniref:Vacuolar protein sorting-associated protein 29 n=1 Tax=Seminavis robusta TaxID=568900 RepID=A0A9N8DWD7_9STRA|nr:phosphodiesterase, mj0936 family [Seminavis robusta]|eukprot:Sro297_g110920.1 phosphodiesterase, mj0936 family (281) ;mRNA; r:43875-44717
MSSEASMKSPNKKRQRSDSEDNNNDKFPSAKKEMRPELSRVRIGLISDTHGVLEESAVKYLAGLPSCRVVIHAEDVGDKRAGRLKPQDLLDVLSMRIVNDNDNKNSKRVVACRGNVDDALPKKYQCNLPPSVLYTVPETRTRILVLHGDGVPDNARIKNMKDGSLRVTEGAWAIIQKFRAQVVIYGHSHLVGCHEYNGVLFINPGSAGPKRFKLPRSCGSLSLTADTESEVVEYQTQLHCLETGKTILAKSGSIWVNLHLPAKAKEIKLNHLDSIKASEE